jgi:hypothetical protein
MRFAMEHRAQATGRSGETWPIPTLDLRALGLLVIAKLLLHVLTAGRYGYFRDELYFLDLGRHLDWGYVDTAPLIGVYAKIALLLGGSLPALRTIAAVAGAARIVLTMLLAREMGGGRFAQGLAGLCALAAPIYLGMDSILTMNGFESLFWMGCIFCVIRFVRTGDSRLWICFGVLAGLGLENKHSTLFFGVAVLAGLVLSRERRELVRPCATGIRRSRTFRTSDAWARMSSCRRRRSSGSRSCCCILCCYRSGWPVSCHCSSADSGGYARSAGRTSCYSRS